MSKVKDHFKSLDRRQHLDLLCCIIRKEFTPQSALSPLFLYFILKPVAGDFKYKTNGKIITFGDKFFEETVFTKQIIWILEVLFISTLGHVGRSRDFVFDENQKKLWSLASKATAATLLNESAFQNKSKFTEHVEHTVESVLRDLGVEKLKQGVRITTEGLFKLLKDAMDGNGDGGGGGESGQQPPPPYNMDDLEDIFSNPNLTDEETKELEGEGKSYDGERNRQAESLENALKQFGKNSADLSVDITDEIRKPTLPWNVILRNLLNTLFNSKANVNWARPNRKTMSGAIRDLNGRVSYLPAYQKEKKIKKIAILIDLSGSCFDKEVIAKFLSEISGVHVYNGTETVILTFDTEVKDRMTIKPNQSVVQALEAGQLKFNGGGGTCFRQPVAKLLEENATVAIVFTDCYGSFPDEPKDGPVFIWCSTGDNAPWGKTIKMDN